MMKKNIALIFSLPLWLSACAANNYSTNQSTSTITTDTPINRTEIKSFYNHVSAKLNRYLQQEKAGVYTAKPQKTLRTTDGGYLVKKIWTMCTPKHPCDNATIKILTSLNYHVMAESTAPSHHHYTYQPHLYYHPYPHYHRYHMSKQKKEIMLASWSNFCSVIKQVKNIPCQSFNQPVYFRDVNGSQYEVYI